MYDQHGVARGQPRQSRFGALDLIDETLAAGRPIAGGRFPERLIGGAELDREIIVTPPGPGAKILFAKRRLINRIEPERECRLARAPRRAADGTRLRRQS